MENLEFLKIFYDYKNTHEALIRTQEDKIKYLSSFINIYAEVFFRSGEENLKQKVGDFILEARRLIPELSVHRYCNNGE